MWLNDLEIAIIERDAEKIGALMDTSPRLTTAKEIEKGQYLLAEAAKVIYELKEETSGVMQKLKKNIDFLKSTSEKKNSRLDVKF
ncbi:MAG: hypothetical protein AB7U24_06435 [Sulfurimonadaceae bacterium]|jgi:hypothetical protein